LPRHRTRLCLCGFPLPRESEGPCGRCRRGLTGFDAGISLGPYDGALRTAIHELKYHGRRQAAARLAEILWDEPDVRRLLGAGVLLVPVPLHPRRLRQRGFNQSELVAQRLARLAGLRVARHALRRRADTPSQTGLSASARRRNVATAFSGRPVVRDKAIVLVDDVFTTGATARACARVLRRAGAAEVRVLTVARVS
jgi:ComF family protein